MVKVLKKGKTTRGEPLRHMPPLVLMQRTVSEHVLRLLDAIYQCRIQYRTYILDIFFVATRESFQWLTFAQLNSVLLSSLLLLKIISFITATFVVVVIIAFNYLLLVIHYYQYASVLVFSWGYLIIQERQYFWAFFSGYFSLLFIIIFILLSTSVQSLCTCLGFLQLPHTYNYYSVRFFFP